MHLNNEWAAQDVCNDFSKNIRNKLLFPFPHTILFFIHIKNILHSIFGTQDMKSQKRDYNIASPIHGRLKNLSITENSFTNHASALWTRKLAYYVTTHIDTPKFK